MHIMYTVSHYFSTYTNVYIIRMRMPNDLDVHLCNLNKIINMKLIEKKRREREFRKWFMTLLSSTKEWKMKIWLYGRNGLLKLNMRVKRREEKWKKSKEQRKNFNKISYAFDENSRIHETWRQTKQQQQKITGKNNT